MSWNLTCNKTPRKNARAVLLEEVHGSAPKKVWDQADAVAVAVEGILASGALGGGPFYVTASGDEKENWVSISIRKGDGA